MRGGAAEEWRAGTEGDCAQTGTVPALQLTSESESVSRLTFVGIGPGAEEGQRAGSLVSAGRTHSLRLHRVASLLAQPQCRTWVSPW